MNTCSYRKQAWLLFLIATLVYANTLFFDFALDDGLMIKHNRITLKGVDGIGEIFTSDQFAGISGESQSKLYTGGRYRPLSQVMFAIEYELFGLNPFVGHLLNVLLFSCLVMLLFHVLRMILPEDGQKPFYLRMPFVVALLFALHPIHTEVVANIKSRDEILGLLGLVLVLWASVRFVDTRRLLYLPLASFFLIFGVLSKENAITVMGLVPLTLFVFRKASLKDHLLVMSPLLLAALAYAALRWAVFGFDYSQEKVESTLLFHNPFMYATDAQRWATILLTWGKYLQLLFFPHPLTHDYYPKQIPIVDWGHPLVLLCAVVFALIVAFAVMQIRKRHVLAYAIFFFFITFSVVSNVVFDLGLFLNERLIFTSSIGFSLFSGYLISAVLPKLIRGKAYMPVALSVMLLLATGYSVKTFSRNFAWKDGETLYLIDVEISTNSGRCNVNTGSILVGHAREESDKQKQLDICAKAENYLVRGLSIYDHNIGGWGALGECYIYQGKYEQAVQAFIRVLNINNRNTQATGNLSYIAGLYSQAGQFPQALQVYQVLLQLDGRHVPYRLGAADILASMGQVDSAIVTVESILETDDKCVTCCNRLGEYYGRHKGDLHTSVRFLQQAYAIDSTYLSSLENLGVAYGIMGKTSYSLKYFQKALKIAPEKESLLMNVAHTYMRMGDEGKARDYYERVQALKR